ncbi:MAG: GNAT family N-acetyltransferase [Butyrivibrio sp.]|uniref:GNAT family N-acetyltransferase n=1 Tax=Butyrivibrio sp. TaxID=28121 RepID=UPI001B2A9095|nr:GNAT family protein [Butyrivibrio sp.]MBO6240596.1 GNAT family N-acetyltransferase [Butyrivibrio sp.]
MLIRKTTDNDIERVMEIYAHARKFMAEHGNPNQWGPTNWPPEYLIREDIKEGCSYACENDDGRIIGTFYYNHGKNVEPTYEKIDDGNWIGDENYGVVHRIASDGTEKGTGSFCIRWALEQCRHLRIDTHSDNIVMQNMLKKLGFSYCGTIYVHEDNDPRMAFEKVSHRI